MRAKLQTCILVLVLGGLCLGIFSFVGDRLQPHWVLQLGGADYGLWVIKSNVFLLFRSAQFEISRFIDTTALSMLALGLMVGMWARHRGRGRYGASN